MRFTRVLLLVSLLALVVAPVALALRFTDDSFNMPQGATGQPYSKTFHGAGGCGPRPARISTGSSRVRCRPGSRCRRPARSAASRPQGGSYDFWVELSDENPPSASLVRAGDGRSASSRSRSCRDCNIVQNALNPKVATLNAPYSFQLTADGGGTPDWSVVSGALPRGISLNSSNGVVAGNADGDRRLHVQGPGDRRQPARTPRRTRSAVVEPLEDQQAARARRRSDCLSSSRRTRPAAGRATRGR